MLAVDVQKNVLKRQQMVFQGTELVALKAIVNPVNIATQTVPVPVNVQEKQMVERRVMEPGILEETVSRKNSVIQMVNAQTNAQNSITYCPNIDRILVSWKRALNNGQRGRL